MAAVIVTYHPEAEALQALLLAARPQVRFLVVVDNTPHESPAAAPPPATAADHWIVNGINRGLAAAQNQGIALARELGASHVILFDQDSLPTPGMVEALLRASLRLTERGVAVGAVGPVWIDRHRNMTAPFVQVGYTRLHRMYCTAQDDVFECDTLVASGCLIALAALATVGPMDEALFIDQVDTEWCMRAQRCGLRLYGICGAVLLHAIGESIVRPWPGSRRAIPVHAPVRDYYLVRNTITVFFRRSAPRRWRLLHAVQLPALILVMITRMPARRRRLRLIGRGVADALRGRLGPIG